MAFRRYFLLKDTSIANVDPTVVGTKDISEANVGASEILNLYRETQFSGVANILLQFPSVSHPSGSEVYLKLFDAQHAETLPAGYTIKIGEIEKAWSEGAGHDFDFYTDLGYANWNSATLSSSWTTPGAFPVSVLSQTFYFNSGHEDLEVDVSSLTGTSNGVVIYIDPDLTSSDLYVKKFHSRQTHFPTKIPYIETRWEDWTGTLSTSSFLVGTSGSYSGSIIPDWAAPMLSASAVHVTNSFVDPTGVLHAHMPNLKNVYDTFEIVRLRLNVRPKDYNPSTVVVAIPEASGVVLLDSYYRIVNDLSGEVVVPFATGTVKYTKLSWDDNGNFFDVRMDSLPTATLMRFDFVYNISGTWTQINGDNFSFRVR